MIKRSATGRWEGNLKEGKGVLNTESGFANGAMTFASRFKDGQGTNPEELIGAAEAGCFSMFLAHLLASDGHPATSVETTATVYLDEGGPQITKIELVTEAVVPGLSEEAYRQFVDKAKSNCPVSKALSATTIEVKSATLKG